jgi:hypothetical protein
MSNGLRAKQIDESGIEWFLLTDEVSIADADDSGRWIAAGTPWEAIP